MASSSSLLSEEQFLCSICLDVFTDPVAIPCGHNFCKACIRKYWDTTDLCQCPMCKKSFDRRPDLFVHQIAPALKKHKLIDPVENLEDRVCKEHDKLLEMFCRTDQTCVCVLCIKTDHKTHYTVPLKEEYGKKKAQLGKMEVEVQQMIQKQLQKVKDIKYSIALCKRDAESEIAGSVQVFTALVRSIERSQVDFIEVVEDKLKAAERQAEGLIKELEQEITELQRRHTELEQLSHTEDHLHLLQSSASLCSLPPTKDWSKISVHSDQGVGTLRRAKLCDAELKMLQQYAVDVTLDPDTASRYLILSKDRKQVRQSNTPNNHRDNPNRFSQCSSVLGKEGFSSGRFYYEVQVKGDSWDLGMAGESSNRKGEIFLSPLDLYWAVVLRNGNEYNANEDSAVHLFLREKPQKVGVFVDYDEGQVSFYDVEARSHIYSFTGCTFTEKLYPYFSPYFSKRGQNSIPLIICPVEYTD
ncbi:unnamed protein product [Oncorhynchus mykiss]|uniref:E3 ubiquitin-protein ligase TRIM39-like n=1 Tax=Oncorhynchus mykiss TaxID=8022 RepID=A0A060W195_ONCMY|nr:unnamed protein product [Oncorhynchus mykiss]